MRRGWLLLLLLSGVLEPGCSARGRVVRVVEAESGASRELRPGPGAQVPVERGAYQGALRRLASEVKAPERPGEAARRLFEVEERSGHSVYDARGRRLTKLEEPGCVVAPATEGQVELAKQYVGWCGRTGRPGGKLVKGAREAERSGELSAVRAGAER